MVALSAPLHLQTMHRYIHRFRPSQNNPVMAKSECPSKILQQIPYEVYSNSAPWRQELVPRNAKKFFRQYRSTPHLSTKFPPFQLLFGRSPRTKLPEIANKANQESAETTQAKPKANAKQYDDRRNKAKRQDFKIGDKVLVKNEKWKTSLQLHINPSHILSRQRQDLCLQAAFHERVVTRNSSFFKKLSDSTNHKREQHQPDSGRLSRKRTVPKYLDDFVRD